MSDIYDLIQDVNQAVNDFITDHCQLMTKEIKQKTGVDYRAFVGNCWYGEDCIIIKTSNKGSFNYYGGFEYHNQELATTIGDYIIYQSDNEDDRVGEVLSRLNG